MDELIKKLSEWRNDDHADNIVLSRNDVCVLLDGTEKLVEVIMEQKESITAQAECIRVKDLEYEGLWDQYCAAPDFTDYSTRTGD